MHIVCVAAHQDDIEVNCVGTKCDLQRMHASQMQKAEKFGGFDLVKLSQIVDAYRRMQCRVDYAEAFRPVLVARASRQPTSLKSVLSCVG